MISLQKIENKSEVLPFLQPAFESEFSYLTKEELESFKNTFFSISEMEVFEKNGFIYRYFYENNEKGGILLFKDCGETIVLEQIILLPKFQKKRYCSFVFAYLRDSEKEITLSCHEKNTHALEVFHHFGFTELLTQNSYIMMRYKYDPKNIHYCHHEA